MFPFLIPLLLVAVVSAGSVGCAPAEDASAPEETAPAEEEDLQARAERLAQEILILDGHVDAPYRLRDQPEDEREDLSQLTEGNFDYVKAKEGGLDAPFMSIYIPASYQEDGGAKELADEILDMVYGWTERWPDKFAVATSPEEVRSVVAEGKIALPLGMENGAPIEGDLENLRHFYDRGIRYVTLTHAEDNHISDSSYADDDTWDGLSPFGEEVVREMNRLGVMVDVSHVSDPAFWDVMEITEAPAIASHSSCRHFTPDWERNMSDEMIRALAENGGVIQINFGSSFLSGEIQQVGSAYYDALRAHFEELGMKRGDPGAEEAADAFEEEYWKDHEKRFADVTDVADHIDHVVELVGVDHVGLGSDFDGVGDSLPTGLKDASDLPNLIRVLLERGYTEEEIEKIASGNVLRVWEEVERVASEMQRSEGSEATRAAAGG